jgi:Tol biopolymer transport system component
MMTLDIPIDWGYSCWNLTVYDPTLTLVVYPSRDLDLIKPSYVIWDLQSDQMVAELPFPEYYTYPPRWAPDGKFFIIANSPLEYLHVEYDPNTPPPNDEFYLISRNGEVLQLTNFADAFEQNINVYHYRWSPDGHYVAFWLDKNLETSPYTADGELAVLDINTQEVTLYCIRGEFMTGGGELPVWSPNSKQILVKSVTEDGEGLVVLVDIVDGWAAEIIEGYTPAGWMVSPQE